MNSENEVESALVRAGDSQSPGGLPRKRDIVEEFLYAQTQAELFGREPTPITLDRFELRRCIGSGGMGVVFSAYDPKLEREVALKRIHVTGAEARTRVMAEARSLAQVRHAGVVTVYDACVDGADVFLTMELLEGRNLATAPGTWKSWRDVVLVYQEALRGLCAAHEAGVLHGDVKPANIVLENENRVVLIDFGLSCRNDGAKGQGGTPSYMSPRRKAGAPPSAASDVYSLLVSLEEQLAAWTPPGRLLKVLRQNRREPESITASALHVVFGQLLRRRRLPYIAALGAVALLSVVAGIAVSRRSAEPSALALCERGATQASDAWATREEAARAGFGNSSWPSGAQFAGPFAAGMHEYATEYESLYRETCQQALRLGTKTEEQLEGERQCFSELSSQFVELADAVAQYPAAARRGMVAVQTLPALTTCHDISTRERRALPQSANVRAQIQETYRSVARLKQSITLGLYAETASDVEEVVRAARALGYEPLIAEALVLDYRRQSGASEEVEVLATLEAAATAANRGRSDVLLAKIWTSAVIGAANLGRFNRSKEYEERALLAVERIGNPLQATSELNFARAVLAQKEGHAKKALALAEDVRLARKELRASPYSMAGVETLIGTLHLDLGAPKQALASLQRASKHLASAVGGLHPQRARVLHSIADALADLGRLDEALETYRAAAAIMRAEYGPEHLGLAITLGAMGLVELSLKRLEDAERSLKESLAIKAKLLPDTSPHLAFAFEQLGVLAIEREHYEEALRRFEQALAQRLKTLEPRSSLVGFTHIRLGVALQYLERNSDADAAFRLANSILSEVHGEDSPPRGLVFYERGVALRALGLCSAALEHYGRAYAHWSPHLSEDDPRLVGVLEELVACYEAEGDLAQSEKFRVLLSSASKSAQRPGGQGAVPEN